MALFDCLLEVSFVEATKQFEGGISSENVIRLIRLSFERGEISIVRNGTQLGDQSA